MYSLQGDDFMYIDIASRGLFSFLQGYDPLKSGTTRLLQFLAQSFIHRMCSANIC